MGDGSEEQRQRDAAQGRNEDLAGLMARVNVLERQVASLAARVMPEVTEAVVIAPLLIEAVDVSTPSVAPLPPPPMFASASAGGAKESLENRLGSQVFSRVGILVVLIGAALFLKLAIDNQWISPAGRVIAGLIAGAGLVLWSERFRRKGFNAFSYTLKAVGSGVLYLTLWAAFQLYQLLPSWAALVAMLLVTAWNAYMAWSQNAQMLAAYALVGGCATPLLLASGGNHESFLFIYLLAIDVATIALVRLRPWSKLLLGVFPATVAYFIGWYAQYYSAEQFNLTSIYVALFFLLFASVPLLRLKSAAGDGAEPEVGRRRGSVLTDILLPLATAAFGALAFYSVLQDSGLHSVLPWMVLVFAVLYLGWMRLPQSAAAAAIHLSLAIVFVTIAVPLKASGHWITVAWLVEGAVLLWVAARLAAAGPVQDDSPTEAYNVLRTLAMGALILGFGGVMFQVYGYHYAEVAFLNRHFATALIGIAAFSVAAWVGLRAQKAAEEAEEHQHLGEKHLWLQIAGVSIVAINVIAVFATVQEIAALWNVSHRVGNVEADLQQALAISAFLMVYGAGLLAIGFWKRIAFIRWQALLLIVFTIGKTFVYDMRNLSQGYRVASFMALGALLLAVSFAYQRDWLALKETTGDAAVPQGGKQEEAR
jgi:uncharacterized membrane protein